MDGKMYFRTLDEKETAEFKASARRSYKPFSDIKGLWHPVYQQECVTINVEQSIFVEPEEKEARR